MGESFALQKCKRFSHFSNKKLQCICNINVLNFNETLTNDVVNLEQPAPGIQGMFSTKVC